MRAELQTMLDGVAPSAVARVTANVALAANFVASVDANAVIFILAKAVDGPAVPLAVTRRTVADLPFTVTLDATMAMMPGVSLADFAAAYVVARISRGGQPIAASGDLEGRSPPFAPGADDQVSIVIDTVVP